MQRSFAPNGTSKSMARVGTIWHTDLYEKRDGQWQIVWSQAIAAPGAPRSTAMPSLTGSKTRPPI